MIRTSMMIAALLAVASGAALRAQAPLLTNGGGESSQRKALRRDRGKQTWDLPGWTSPGPRWIAAESGWSRVRAHSGDAFLTCGRTDGGSIYQDIASRALPSRATHVALLAWARSYDGRDEHGIALSFFDRNERLLARTTSPGRRAEQWGQLSLFARVPARTHSLRVELLARKYAGKWCDAFFDDVAVLACGPGVSSELAKLWTKALEQRWESAAPRERAELELAMAFGPSKAYRVLQKAFEASADRSEKQRLLGLLLAQKRSEGNKLVRSVLRSKNAEDADLQAACLERVDILSGWQRICAKLLTNKNRRLADAALDRLTRKPDKACISALTGYANSRKPATMLRVLEGLRASRAPAKLYYASLIKPNLAAQSDSKLRNEAMLILAEQGDERFREQLPRLLSLERSRWMRGQWIRGLSNFDDVRSIEMALGFVERGVDRAAASFLELLPLLRARACTQWIAKQGLLHKSGVVRLASVHALTLRAREHRASLTRHLDDPDTEVAVAAARALADVEDPAARASLEAITRKDRHRVSAAALRAMAKRDARSADALAAKLAPNAKAWTLRAAAIDVRAAHDADAARPAIVEATKDRDPRVRISAYLALTKIRTRTSLEVLLAAIEREDAHVGTFLLDALHELTGIENGDAASWKRWWELARDDFRIPARAPNKKRAIARGDGTSASYYGIPLVGKSFVFVLDLSGSMREDEGGRTRLAAAKAELEKALRALPGDTRFNIVAFSTSPRAYRGELVPTSKKEVTEAVHWMQSLEARGSTNVFDSLDLALGMRDVECVFLLTDGGPSTGLYTDKNRIREVVRDKNRELRVRIHTISTGGSKRDRDFLRKLAEENWGRAQAKE